MSRRTVLVNLWLAGEAEGCDDAAGRRDVELGVEGGLVVEAHMVAPGVAYRLFEIPLGLLRSAMIGERDWAAWQADAVRLAERQAADPVVRFEAAMDARDGRAEEQRELRESFS